MRCLALAQAWNLGQRNTTFIMNDPSAGVKQRLRDEGIGLICVDVEPGSSKDAETVLNVISREKVAGIVIDGYNFGPTYQKYLYNPLYVSMIIDDNSQFDTYCADILLNQNPFATPELYNLKTSNAKLLLGAKYALLRKEFAKWQKWKKLISKTASRVLISLGGSQTTDITFKIIEALETALEPDAKVDLVIGINDKALDKIEKTLKRFKLQLNIIRHCNEISELMAQADIAISTGGTTCMELAFMGVPSILLILADNQQANVEYLSTKGCAINLGSYSSVSSSSIAEVVLSLMNSFDNRLTMSRIAQGLIDGYGSRRVKAAIVASNLKIRPSTINDCYNLWKWRNDPDARIASFSKEPIEYRDHLRWFKAKLQNDKCKIYVIQLKSGEPIGQIRYEIEGSEAETSIAIDPDYRNLGIGSSGLRLNLVNYI